MKVGDIITRVRGVAGDDLVLQFTDSQIVDWLNDGIRECAIQNNLLQKNATSNTVAGTAEYTLPPDILKLHSVTVAGEKLRGQTLQEFQDSSVAVQSGSDTGQPVVFYVWADKITLSPIPDTIKSMVVSYTYNPVDLTFAPVNPGSGVADNATKIQVLSLPVGYQSRLVDYCLAQVAQQDGDNNLYAIKMQEFQTGVTMLKDQPEYTQDMYPSISVSARDSGWDF